MNAKITDLWTGKDIGNFSNTFSPEIKPHGCGFYRISVNQNKKPSTLKLKAK
jgi:hypothetical protein